MGHTSLELQSIAVFTAETLKVEIDSARLMNLGSANLSYETLHNLSELLLGLSQCIKNQNREIDQLRERIGGSSGSPPKEPFYQIPKRNTHF